MVLICCLWQFGVLKSPHFCSSTEGALDSGIQRSVGRKSWHGGTVGATGGTGQGPATQSGFWNALLLLEVTCIVVISQMLLLPLPPATQLIAVCCLWFPHHLDKRSDCIEPWQESKGVIPGSFVLRVTHSTERYVVELSILGINSKNK